MIETIFIDTSIFIYENFLESSRIKTLLDLAEKGHINIALPEITVNEVKNQFLKRAHIAFDKHNELVNDKQDFHIRVLRNNTMGEQIIKRMPAIKKIIIEFNDQFDEALKKARVKILPYPTINIGEVFKKYFKGEPPFGSGMKKEEFPDAFAIAQIEKLATEKKQTVTVLTTDKDFDNITSEYIKVVKNLIEFLDIKLKQVTEEERVDKLNDLYHLKSQQIDNDIIEWVKDEFDDDGVFLNFTNWMEIYEKTIDFVNVVSKKYELIATDIEYLTIEVNAIISYKVSLNIDDENSGIWDSEDKEMLFRENITFELAQSDLEVTVKLQFNIFDAEDYEDDYEILEINGGKEIDIDPDGFDYEHY